MQEGGARPGVLEEYVPGQLWLEEYPIRYGGCRFRSRMTVVRLPDGRILIHSPGPMGEATRSSLPELGEVAFLVAPGNFHHIHVVAARRAFPHARTYVCPGVERKQPQLAIDGILSDTAETTWAGALDQVLVRGCRFMWEVAFFHKPSRTLILTDLIEKIGDSTPGTDRVLRFWWKVVMRMWNRPRPAPEYQMGWMDRGAARKSLERILSWDFDRIVISHGDLIERNAKEVAREAWQKVLRAT